MALITCHRGLNDLLSKIGLANYYLCDACLEETETEIHFLCECPTFARISNEFFGVNVIDQKLFLTKEFNLINKLFNSTRMFLLP